MSRIDELIQAYPNVDLRNEAVATVRAIALRWLKEQSALRARATVRVIERQTRNPQAERVRRDSAVSNAVNRITREAASRIVSEWGPTLLAQSFALPDGRVVTWGTATVQDHEARAAFLEAQASGIAETASQHQKAINELRAARKTTLNELETE